MHLPQLNIIEVGSLEDPRLEVYRNQKDAWLRARHNPEAEPGTDALAAGGLFMAEGTLVVEQLLASRYRVHSLLVARERVEGVAGPLGGLDRRVPVYTLAGGKMDELVGFHIHRGVLAAGVRGEPLGAESLLAQSRTVVVMEDLANHDNVGGIFRSVAALGGPGSGVLHSGRTCDPLYRKALRVSMGHVLRVPFAEDAAWERGGVERLREAGLRTVALTPGPDAVDLRDLGVGSGERIALIVGTEGAGVRPETAAIADLRVRIPMDRGVDSLNVTVAASVALYHLRVLSGALDGNGGGSGSEQGGDAGRSRL